jgi:hypothetical protein
VYYGGRRNRGRVLTVMGTLILGGMLSFGLGQALGHRQAAPVTQTHASSTLRPSPSAGGTLGARPVTPTPTKPAMPYAAPVPRAPATHASDSHGHDANAQGNNHGGDSKHGNGGQSPNGQGNGGGGGGGGNGGD